MNAARLTIELFCRGVRIDGSCDLEADARSIRRTRAGLGSGLELCVRGRRKEHWVNVPIAEEFAQRSPYVLVKQGSDDGGRYYIVDTSGGVVTGVRVPAEPAWYSRATSTGREMAQIGVLQGTYLGIYLGGICAFWAGQGLDACGFCTTGKNVGDADAPHKTVDE